MNFLAHAALSFHEPGLLIGNMISDFVKGKKQYDYPAEIYKGIRLHRAIDEFTDNHELTKEAKAFFRKDYRLYAGAVVDVVYDHYLANDVNVFAVEQALATEAAWVYATLAAYEGPLPERFTRIQPYMSSQNWLYHYRSRTGLGKSLQGLVHRSAYLEDATAAFRVFEANYQQLENLYHMFFPELQQMSIAFIRNWQ